jgi:CheY-like chemotaxis protein
MVYLVDDDIDDLEFVQEALFENSYKGPVNTVPNGKVLMDLLTKEDETQKPDVILLDLNMPLKNGFQALEEIRNNPSLKNIPVIILTASSKKEDEIKCFELGCNLFCTKPNNLHEYNSIVKIVKSFVAQSAA